ncbi:hypothetical protein PACTADRAFT_3232 [Pachysolen tannophilus NRRL Y-2460]|uniref:NTF2 domain-containing protein n=1 Tax=Pachysolen tannophilus NRRL Y-2460 TaxID=669874 RepID=A0A1E4TUX1_PACTA|nr:hypothetical protein PACTADRAFT_3232 [Pachysolen tannophilus NRRL Y-2460]
MTVSDQPPPSPTSLKSKSSSVSLSSSPIQQQSTDDHVRQVGVALVQIYYTRLNSSFDTINQLYSKNASITHQDPFNSNSASLIVGNENIKKFFQTKSRLQGCKVKISSIDIQRTINDSILIVCVGELAFDESQLLFKNGSNGNNLSNGEVKNINYISPAYRFIQNFLVTKTFAKGNEVYDISNDILKFIPDIDDDFGQEQDEEEEEEEEEELAQEIEEDEKKEEKEEVHIEAKPQADSKQQEAAQEIEKEKEKEEEEEEEGEQAATVSELTTSNAEEVFSNNGGDALESKATTPEVQANGTEEQKDFVAVSEVSQPARPLKPLSWAAKAAKAAPAPSAGAGGAASAAGSSESGTGTGGAHEKASSLAKRSESVDENHHQQQHAGSKQAQGKNSKNKKSKSKETSPLPNQNQTPNQQSSSSSSPANASAAKATKLQKKKYTNKNNEDVYPIYIRGIVPGQDNDSQLQKNLEKKFGKIRSCKISDHIALVDFVKEESQEKAIKLGIFKINGHELKLEPRLQKGSRKN